MQIKALSQLKKMDDIGPAAFEVFRKLPGLLEEYDARPIFWHQMSQIDQ